MPCEGLQAQGQLGEELEYFQMRMPVEHYRHAKEIKGMSEHQALSNQFIGESVDVHLATQGRC